MKDWAWRRGILGHFGQQDGMVVATMEGQCQGKEERTEKEINAGKGRTLTVIICWETVIQAALGKARKERSRKLGIGKHHHITQ